METATANAISVNIPVQSDFSDITKESIDECVDIVKFNALNS